IMVRRTRCACKPRLPRPWSTPGGPRASLPERHKCGTLTTAADGGKWGLWYVPALVRGPGRGVRTLACVVLAGAAVSATLPAGGSAENAGGLRRRAPALRAENAQLQAGAESAAAGLVAIERRLSQTRAELAAFRAK